MYRERYMCIVSVFDDKDERKTTPCSHVRTDARLCGIEPSLNKSFHASQVLVDVRGNVAEVSGVAHFTDKSEVCFWPSCASSDSPQNTVTLPPRLILSFAYGLSPRSGQGASWASWGMEAHAFASLQVVHGSS